MDGGGGTINHRVFRDVKSGKVSIKNDEHFAAHADAILNGIKSLYISIDEVLKEPEDIEKSSPRIDGTLEVHKIARSFSTDGACKLEFFKTAVENNHFMYNITRRMGIQMFVLTLSFPCAIILIKSVLSAMVFMPKIRSGWSAIYVINGFIKNVFSFRFAFFLKYCSETIFARFRRFSTFCSIFHEVFGSFVTNGQVFEQPFEIIS